MAISIVDLQRVSDITLDIGKITRPLPGFLANGDRYYIEEVESGLMIAVIDGLGHGIPASEATDIAIECMRDCRNLPLEAMYSVCHQRLLGTRGVVAATVIVDEESSQITYAGVGNIEGSVCAGETAQELFWRYGILGSGSAPHISVHEMPFERGSMLILHSDGISNKFRVGEYYGLDRQPAQFIADVLLRDWARANDDATIVVVRRED